MKKNNFTEEKDFDKITLGIISIIIFAVLFVEIIAYFRTKTFESDLFSPAVGLTIWFCFYINSQRIIDNNLFKKIITISIAIIFICFLKQALTEYNYTHLTIAGIPLIFSIYFRLLVSLFYKNYPKLVQIPVIIFATQFGNTDFKDKDEGYKPTMKERVFSLMLFIGFIFLCLGFVIVLKRFEII